MDLARPFFLRSPRGLIASAALAASCSVAAAQTLDAAYSITLGGLSVGSANLRVSVAGEKYDLALSAKLTGLLGAVSGGAGTATAGGALRGDQPLPASFALRSSNGKESRTVRMALAAGNVENLAIEPPLPARPGDERRVPLLATHRRGVVDPISALVMPAKAPAGPGALDPASCNRTIPVFDGATRFDITLGYKATQQAAAGTFAGPVLVCSVRYKPVAGHRPDRKSTQFMAENRDIEVWLAPVAGSRVLVPLRITVQTQFGLNVIQAAQFRITSSEAAR